MLSRKVDPEQLLAKLQASLPENTAQFHVSNHTVEPIPKFHIKDESLDPRIAYQTIHEELELDGRPNLNLASFVNTDVGEFSGRLAMENLTKNLADASEYPAMMNVHQRCVSIISHLWNVPDDCQAVGTACTGSSEAVQLGGLALKKRWQKMRSHKGLSTENPNIVMGANAQVALEKFARYFDVEGRMVPVNEKSRYCMDVSRLHEFVDENTIGVYVIMGSTYTGHYESVEAVDKVLERIEQKTGYNVPIHVDAASGGFIAPFLTPDLKWDFRIPRVHSINTSGHKFGLATAGVGWIIFKDQSLLPEELVFKLSYLGGVEESFTLNFSRPGHQVIQQYFNLVSLGKEGYKKEHGKSLANARVMARFLEETEYYEVLSDIHRPNGSFETTKKSDHTRLDLQSENHTFFNAGLPVVSFRFSDEFQKEYPEIPQSAVSSLLKLRGYIIPNYPLPPDVQGTEVLRVVVRTSMPTDMLDRLLQDIVIVTEQLMTAAQKYRSGTNDTQHARSLLEIITAPEEGFIEHEKSWLVDAKDSWHHKNPRFSIC